MKKIHVLLIALSVSILLVGCNSSNANSNNTNNNQAKADWPVYDFDTLIEKTDVVAFVEVDSNEKSERDGLQATLSTLKVTDVLYGSLPESIIAESQANRMLTTPSSLNTSMISRCLMIRQIAPISHVDCRHLRCSPFGVYKKGSHRCHFNREIIFVRSSVCTSKYVFLKH